MAKRDGKKELRVNDCAFCCCVLYIPALLVDFTLSGAPECNIQLLPFIMFHIGPEGRPVFCAPYNFESFNNDDAFSNHLIIDTLRRSFSGRSRTRARKSKRPDGDRGAQNAGAARSDEWPD